MKRLCCDEPGVWRGKKKILQFSHALQSRQGDQAVPGSVTDPCPGHLGSENASSIELWASIELCFELFAVALELVSLDISRWLCLEAFFPHKASTIFVQEQRRQKYFEETLYADDKIKSSQMSLVSHSSTRRFRSLWCSGEVIRVLSYPVFP